MIRVRITNKSKVMFIILLCSTYGYLRISISFVTPTGDLNKYKSAISTSICISLLYEFMKILISVIVYLLLLYAYYK